MGYVISSLLWRAVEFGRLHRDFTTHDLICCKNLLSGQKIAEQGGEVPEHKSLELARVRDVGTLDIERDGIGIPGPRHVEMMKWFTIEKARLLMAYSDLIDEREFLQGRSNWYVAVNIDGSFELIVEADPWAGNVDARARYIRL